VVISKHLTVFSSYNPSSGLRDQQNHDSRINGIAFGRRCQRFL
jgi:hypothetical protein